MENITMAHKDQNYTGRVGEREVKPVPKKKAKKKVEEKE